MIYIVMCGGEYRDWETPRQLLEIQGEPIVGRTIRLIREAGVPDIAISAQDPRFEAFGVPVLRHDNTMVVSGGRVSGCWARAFLFYLHIARTAFLWYSNGKKVNP